MASNMKVSPYIFSRDATKHIEWLKNVFDAEALGEIHYFDNSTRVMHACVGVNGGKVMISDYEEGKSEKNATDRGIAICLDYENGNGAKFWKKGVDNGAKVETEYEVQFWGAYFGLFEDPFGFQWMIHEMIVADKQNQES